MSDSDDGNYNRVEDDEDDDDEIEREEKLPDGCFKVRPSGFKGIPPTVYVDYPSDLGIIRTDAGYVELLSNRILHFKCAWERNCIKNCFQRAGFSKDDSNWTAMWSKHQTDTQMKDLNCLQKINHFPGSWCVGRKDRLLTLINAMKRIRGNAFDFHPDGFVVPHEHDALLRVVRAEVDKAKKAAKKVHTNLWILKPVAASQGKGIKVVNSQQVVDWMTAKANKGKSALFQRYLYDPYLINGHKFDLRIYVLVTGVDPLRVYIHQEGLTRISTVAYSLKNTKNRFAHLTNYSINKKSAAFVAASESGVDGVNDDADIEGFKWSLKGFKKWLSKTESPDIMERTFLRINDLVVKTMIAAEAEITPRMHNAANYRTNCFELFGLDVILNSKLEPSLLEVNISPSLMGSSPLDKKIKGTLVADILHVVGLYPHDENWLRKISRIDENQPGVFGSARQRSNTPTKNGKPKRRARSLSRGKEKLSSGTSGGSSTKDGGKSAAADRDGQSHHRSSSVSNSPMHLNSRPPLNKEPDDAPQFLLNPFAFNSLSILMNNQDEWRRNPCCENVDFAQFKGNSTPKAPQSAQRGRNVSRTENFNTSAGSPSTRTPSGGAAAATDSIWVILLMIEDEFARAAHSHFHLLHPSPHTVVDYLKLYRSARFSDHLIAKWVLNNGMYGKLREFVPSKFLKSSFTGTNIGTSTGIASPAPGLMVGMDSTSNKMKLVKDVLRNRGEIQRQVPVATKSFSEKLVGRTPVVDVSALESVLTHDVTAVSKESPSRNIPFSPISHAMNSNQISHFAGLSGSESASASGSPIPTSLNGGPGEQGLEDVALSNFQRLQLAREETSPNSMKNTNSSAAHFARRSAEKATRESQRQLVSSIASAARLSSSPSNTTIVLNDSNVYQEPCLSARSSSNGNSHSKSGSSRSGGRCDSSDRLLQRPHSANRMSHSGSRKDISDQQYLQANTIRMAGANVVGYHPTANNIASGLSLSSAATGKKSAATAARMSGHHPDMGVVGSRPASAGTGPASTRTNSARGTSGVNNPVGDGRKKQSSTEVAANTTTRGQQRPQDANSDSQSIRLSYGMQFPGI